ncbi:MAG: hypothetical protein ACLPQS_07840 [Acidimicrobiales bacterium]
MIAAEAPPEGDGSPDGGELPARARPVFISDFVHLPVRFDSLVPVLMDVGAAWLRDLEDPMPGRGPTHGGFEDPRDDDNIARVRVRLGVGTAHSGLAVLISSGPPRFRDHNVIVPITWDPVSFEQLLPRLEGDLEMSDFGGAFTRLALTGRYRVPLGQLGLGIDRIAMHRVAEGSVRGFLRDVQESVLSRQ